MAFKITKQSHFSWQRRWNIPAAVVLSVTCCTVWHSEHCTSRTWNRSIWWFSSASWHSRHTYSLPQQGAYGAQTLVITWGEPDVMQITNCGYTSFYFFFFLHLRQNWKSIRKWQIGYPPSSQAISLMIYYDILQTAQVKSNGLHWLHVDVLPLCPHRVFSILTLFSN